MPRIERTDDTQGPDATADLPGTTNMLVRAADVRHVAGPVTDATVAAVLKAGPSMEDLEVAASYLRGEGGQRSGHPMSGKVAQLCDILSADALYMDDDA